MKKIIAEVSRTEFEKRGNVILQEYAKTLEAIPDFELWVEPIGWELFYRIGKKNHKVYYRAGKIRDMIIQDWSIEEKELLDAISPLHMWP